MNSFIAITVFLLTTAAMQAKPYQIGNQFPAITLPSLENGEPLSVIDFRGQKLLLQIFASW